MPENIASIKITAKRHGHLKNKKGNQKRNNGGVSRYRAVSGQVKVLGAPEQKPKYAWWKVTGKKISVVAIIIHGNMPM